MAVRTTRSSRGFTLVELLIVLGIILVLAGILIPVVGKMQLNAKAAATGAQIQAISGAIEQYHSQFRAYPGPISNNDIAATVSGGTFNNIAAPVVPSPQIYSVTPWNTGSITMSENLVLGLLGGLTINNTGVIGYDPAQVGLGPMNLSTASPKRYPPFYGNTDLDWQDDPNSAATPKPQTGQFFDHLATANDTIIPEFVDRFSNPLPILYMRSKLGISAVASPTAINNSIITDGTQAARAGAYDMSQIIAYTGVNIGLGKSLPQVCQDGSGTMVSLSTTSTQTPYHGLAPIPGGSAPLVDVTATLDPSQVTSASKKYYFPYNAYAYFQNPSVPGTPRAKDGYILISAGKDRVYGTDDDITSFGAVVP
jgi:prepilin-type N-terminal cleavage/methylation domain-containing protein